MGIREESLEASARKVVWEGSRRGVSFAEGSLRRGAPERKRGVKRRRMRRDAGAGLASGRHGEGGGQR